jgi:hypothetical protein
LSLTGGGECGELWDRVWGLLEKVGDVRVVLEGVDGGDE